MLATPLRLTVATRLLFGERDFTISPKTLTGYEDHAHDMEIELLPDSGHFLAEEKPELVAERALAFCAGLNGCADLAHDTLYARGRGDDRECQ